MFVLKKTPTFVGLLIFGLDVAVNIGVLSVGALQTRKALLRPKRERSI
jgi:hypothetical protein